MVSVLCCPKALLSVRICDMLANRAATILQMFEEISMTIILDRFATPERGRLEIHTTVEIEVSADEARKKVDHWLLEQVSSSFGASLPVLVIGERAVWRVPILVGFSQRGSFEIGSVTVDALTGTMNSSAQQAFELQQAASVLITRLPAYQPRRAAEGFSVAHLPEFANLAPIHS